ncbi:unnamed protein product [Taenia asiatica]|uniref:Uncharacterized protein n=1 Tax=Taenia asiatica TaxID=60517 RepID=A0A0R3WH69_TAEAS|nr:unnamed protein product [Taenia asiatica]
MFGRVQSGFTVEAKATGDSCRAGKSCLHLFSSPLLCAVGDGACRRQSWLGWVRDCEAGRLEKWVEVCLTCVAPTVSSVATVSVVWTGTFRVVTDLQHRKVRDGIAGLSRTQKMCGDEYGLAVGNSWAWMEATATD